MGQAGGSLALTDPQASAPRLLIVATIAATVHGFLRPFAEHFRALGWRVDAAAAGIDDHPLCRDAFDEVFDLSWSRQLTDAGNRRQAVDELRALVVSQRYDLVHFHTPIASFFGRFALRKVRRAGELAVVYTAHGFHFHEHGSPLRNSVFRYAEKTAGRWTDHLVTINEDDHQAALQYRLVPPDRLSLIPSIGLDTSSWAPGCVDRAAVDGVRAEMGIEDGESLILMVASHQPEKHHDVAIRSFARLHDPSVHLALAGGDGPTKARNHELVVSLGIADRVHFLGSRRDVPTLMTASTMTLSTSSREGMSRATMESMSLAVPVVGARIRGVRDLVGDDKCGILVDVGDEPGFTQAMRRLLDSPDLCEHLGTAGRNRILAYDVNSVMRSYEKQVYAHVLG